MTIDIDPADDKGRRRPNFRWLSKREMFTEIPVLEKMQRLSIVSIDETRVKIKLHLDFVLWLVRQSYVKQLNTPCWQLEDILQDYTGHAFTTYEIPDAVITLEVLLREMAAAVGMRRRVDTP